MGRENGQPLLAGNPSTPQHGTTDIDLQGYADALKDAASYALTADSSNSTFGNSSNDVTVYADATGTQADHELRLNNVTGYGILVVKGDCSWPEISTGTGPLLSPEI